MMKSGKSKKVERGRRLNVNTNIKKYNDGVQATVSKLSMKSIVERLTEHVDGVWYGADVLYYVQTQKRGISLTQQRSERYLLLLRRKETPKLLHLVQVVVKDNNIDVKRSWDLPMLRAIDLGDDDNEFVLSFDSADYSWFVNGQAERDETVWILAQMCKVICGYDLSLGHHVDMDLIGYAAKTTGTLSRFPLLQELNNSAQIAGDVFSEEETEAEILLSELKWVSEAPSELLHTISKQSDSLNLEIIDFLLQWEDDGDAKSADTNASGTAKDTYKVLRALTTVDTELASVDKWIEEQVIHLEKTQGKLQKIENESGALETSYQNLSSVQQLVGTVVSQLSLSPEQEELLTTPSKVLNTILSKDSLRNISKYLRPLLEACDKLQSGLCHNGKTLGNIAPTVWKQLLTVQAVSSQRNRLSEISDYFCKDLSDSFPAFIDGLTDHPNMNDASKGRMILVKHFTNLNQMISTALLPPGVELFPKHVDLELLGCGGSGTNRSAPPDDAMMDYVPLESRSLGYVMPKSFFCCTGNQVNSLNDGLQAQSLFHTTLNFFRPLLTHVQELDSSIMAQFCTYYTQGPSQEKLYNPMIKGFFKGIQSLLPSAKSYVTPTMASVPAYRASKGFEVIMKYLHASVFYPGGGGGISRSTTADMGKKGSKDTTGSSTAQQQDSAALLPWTAFAVFLVTLGPIVRAEESFFTQMFHSHSSHHGGSSDSATNTMGLALLNNVLVADSEAEVAFSRIHANSYSLPLFSRGNVANYEKCTSETCLDTVFAGLRAEVIVGNMLPTQKTSKLGVTMLTKGITKELKQFTNAASTVGASGSTSASGSGPGGGSSSKDDVEGVECVGMLVCLQQYVADYFGISFDGFLPMIDVSVLHEPVTTSNPTNSILNSSTASTAHGLEAQMSTATTPSTTGSSNNYWLTVLLNIREDLLFRIDAFLSLQLQWILEQKSDPKRAGAANCVSKLPNIIRQLLEMTGKQVP
jgi:hypothetical protein